MNELDDAIASAKRELKELRARIAGTQLTSLQRELAEVRAECARLEERLSPLREEEARLRAVTR